MLWFNDACILSYYEMNHVSTYEKGAVHIGALNASSKFQSSITISFIFAQDCIYIASKDDSFDDMLRKISSWLKL